MKDLLIKVKRKNEKSLKILRQAKMTALNKAASRFFFKAAAIRSDRACISFLPKRPDELLQWHSKCAETCLQTPSCKHGMVCLRNAFCP